MSTAAPALTRGLRILEYLAARTGPCGFNELLSALTLPRASGARLLQVLCREEYVAKVPGAGYRLGPAVARLTLQSTLRERLSAEAPPVLATLRDDTGTTAALFQYAGSGTVVIDKAMHPDAVAMQAVGNEATLNPDSPWAAVLYSSLCSDEQAALEAAWQASGADRRSLDGMCACYATHGFALDNAVALPGVRRLAAPVYDRDGALVAAVGAAGMCYTIDADRLEEVGAAVVAAGTDLSQRLGCRETTRFGSESETG